MKAQPPGYGSLAGLARYPLQVLLGVFLFVAINIDLPGAPSWHDGQRLLQLAALILALVMCAWGCAGANLSVIWRSCPIWVRGALVLSLLLGLCSVALAALPRWALLEWSMTLGLGLLAMGVASSFRFRDARRDWVLVGCIYAVALAYSLKSALAYVLMFSVGPDYRLAFSVEELFPGFSNVRFFGHLQTMLLPFLVLPGLWWGRTRAQQILLMVVPAVWWALAIASGTRGSWVALMIAALVVWFVGGRFGWRLLKWQAVSLLAGFVIYMIFILGLPGLLPTPAAFLHRVDDLVSLRGRAELWALCFDLLSHHPWFGIGPMHFAMRLSEIAAHPHNAVLQWMVEWGIPAALLITTVLAAGGFSFAIRLYRCCNSSETGQEVPIMIAVLAAIAGAAAQAMVDGIAVMPVSQTLLALFCGWAWGWQRSAALIATPRTTAFAFRLIVLIAVAGLMVGVWPEIGNLEARLESHLQVYPQGATPRLLPRFWVHGWIP